MIHAFKSHLGHCSSIRDVKSENVREHITQNSHFTKEKTDHKNIIQACFILHIHLNNYRIIKIFNKYFDDLMSKNTKMLDIKMNDTIPDIKNFTIFLEQTHNRIVYTWLKSLKNSLIIYKFFLILFF